MCSTKKALSGQVNRGFRCSINHSLLWIRRKEGSEISDSEIRVNPWDKCGVEGEAREVEISKHFGVQKSMSEFPALTTELQWLYLCPGSFPHWFRKYAILMASLKILQETISVLVSGWYPESGIYVSSWTSNSIPLGICTVIPKVGLKPTCFLSESGCIPFL